MKRRHLLSIGACAAAAFALFGAGTAFAQQQFPERPITVFLPYGPGGTTDQVVRALAKAVEVQLQQKVIVINKPGASGAIAMSELAQAKPDGYTLGSLSSTQYLLPAQGREVPYNPLTSFSFISFVGDNLMAVAVLKDSPYATLNDLIADAKKSPGKLKYTTGGAGSTPHMTAESMNMSAGIKTVHIPQQTGSAGSMPALIGKHVDYILDVSVWAPFLQQGQVRLLAMATEKRSPLYPDVPSFGEFGFTPQRSVQAILGPAGIPEPTRLRLEGAFRKALQDESFAASMRRLSMDIIDMPGAEVKQFVSSEIAKAKDLMARVKAAGQ